MIRGLYTSASGMTTQIKKQDTVANNVANINTNGFKKSKTVMTKGKEFEIYRKEDSKNEFIEEVNPKAKLTKIGKLGTGVKVAENFVAHEQGVFKKTEENLDLALEGKGFFAFQTKNGVRYSRNGALSIDKDGYLVDSNGAHLLACNFQGDLAYVKQSSDTIEFLEDGSIRGAVLDSAPEALRELDSLVVNMSSIQNPRDMIFIREFTDLKDLQQEGNNYFYLENDDELLLSEANKIHQGFLEGSNVNIVKEMVEMINVSRLYETNQKILTSQEETLTKADEISKWT